MTNALNELHGRIQQRQRSKARPGRYFMSEATKPRDIFSNVRSYQLTTADHPEAYLFALFTAARQKRLDVRIEGGPEGSRLECLCSDVDWASLKMSAYHEVKE